MRKILLASTLALTFVGLGCAQQPLNKISVDLTAAEEPFSPDANRRFAMEVVQKYTLFYSVQLDLSTAKSPVLRKIRYQITLMPRQNPAEGIYIQVAYYAKTDLVEVGKVAVTPEMKNDYVISVLASTAAMETLKRISSTQTQVSVIRL